MAAPKTPEGVLSFPHLFTPRPPAPGADPRYSMVLIFDEAAQSTPEYKQMKKAVLEAAREKWGEKAETMLKNGQVRVPFRDASEKNQYQGYEDGKVFVSLWSKQPPGVVDTRLQDVMPGDVFAGMKARATFNAFAYDTSGNRGVSLGLGNVQITKADMPRLDGRASASQEFDALDEGGEAGAEAEDMPF